LLSQGDALQQSHHSTSAAGLATAALTLSEADVARLMMGEAADVRIDVTDKIAGTYASTNLDRGALQAAEQIFRLLVRDTEVKVRVAMAGHIKNSTRIPRDIVMELVRDVEEVALPMLEFSKVLSDKDILELIDSQQEVKRYLALSRRKEVSESVALALINTGNAQVAGTLVANEGAEISEDGFGRIVDLHQDNESMLRSLGDRPGVPVAVVEKIVGMVSAQLASALRKKHNLEPEQISSEVEQSHEDETLMLVRYAAKEVDAEKLVHQLHLGGGLTPSIILSALCQGNFAFFELCLARLSNIPLSNARTLIADRGELGFRAIYNKAGLPEGMFPAVKLLLQVVRMLADEGVHPNINKYASAVVERLLLHSQQTPVENLAYVIALVRRVAR